LPRRRKAMLLKGVKTLVIYLEDWQKRMIKDFLGEVCDTFEVEIKTPPILRYGVPTHEESKRMYFTDWQIREMRDEAGVVCEFIELTKDVPPLVKYKAPPR
jgi:hypothetical protein